MFFQRYITTLISFNLNTIIYYFLLLFFLPTTNKLPHIYDKPNYRNWYHLQTNLKLNISNKTEKQTVKRDESIYSSSTTSKQSKSGGINGSGKRPIFMKAIKGCDIERKFKS